MFEGIVNLASDPIYVAANDITQKTPLTNEDMAYIKFAEQFPALKHVARDIVTGDVSAGIDKSKLVDVNNALGILENKISGAAYNINEEQRKILAKQLQETVEVFPEARRTTQYRPQEVAFEWDRFNQTGKTDTSEWIDIMNPSASIVQVGNEKFGSRNPIVAQALRSAIQSIPDDTTKGLFVRTVGVQNGSLGGGLTPKKLEIITGAMGNKLHMLIKNEADKVFMDDMDTDINNLRADVEKRQRGIEKDPTFLGLFKPTTIAGTIGIKVSDVKNAEIRTVLENNPELRQIFRAGVEGGDTRLAQVAYLLAREKAGSKIIADLTDDINNKLASYIGGLQDLLPVNKGLSLSDGNDLAKLTAEIEKVAPQGFVSPEVLPRIDAGKLAQINDIIKNIDVLKRKTKEQYDKYLTMGLTFEGNTADNLAYYSDWMTRMTTKEVPRAMQLTGVVQNIPTTAVFNR